MVRLYRERQCEQKCLLSQKFFLAWLILYVEATTVPAYKLSVSFLFAID